MPAVPPLAGLETAIAPSIPAVTALPALEDTFFCRDAAGGAPRHCREEELKTCRRGPKGELPPETDCPMAGVPWASRVCPPGFLVQPSAADAMAACLPDPAECGTDPYGDPTLVDGPTTVFVDQAAGDDKAPGTRAQPKKSIQQALYQAPSGGVVAVASGNYQESLTIVQSVQLRGRCAAKVTVSAPAPKMAVLVTVLFGGATVGLQGLRLTGPGGGVEVQGTVDLSLKRLAISGVRRAGILAYGQGVKLSLSAAVIEETAPFDSNLTQGAGAVVYGGVSASLMDVRLSGNRDHGVLIDGPGTAVEATRLLVDATAPRVSDNARGRGIGVSGGAHLALTQARLSANCDHGLHVEGLGSAATAKGLLIDGTRAQQSDLKWGRGASAQFGGQLELSAARLSGNRDVGLYAYASGSKVKAAGLLVDGTRVRASDLTGGKGVVAQAGGRLELADCRLTGNRDAGMLLDGSGAMADVSRLLIDGTRSLETSGEQGGGAQVQLGAKLTLQQGRMTANHLLGLLVQGAGASVQATGLIVDGTQGRELDGAAGYGVVVEGGGRLTLHDSRLSGNRAVGLFAIGLGSEVSATQLVVDGTRHQASDQILGRGIVVQDKAHLSLVDTRISGNRDLGLAVGEAASAQATRLVVDGTMSLKADGSSGRGVGVGLGGHLDLQDARLSGNRGAGLTIVDKGSRCRATGLIVDGSLPQEDNGDFGRGVEVQQGGSLELQGGHLVGNRELGLSAAEADVVRLVGTSIRDTAVNKVGWFGFGLLVGGPTGDAQVLSCALTGNRTAAAAFLLSSGSIRNSVISGTLGAAYTYEDGRRGKEQPEIIIADGVIVDTTTSVAIDGVLAMGNLRAGLFVRDAPGTVLTNSYVSGSLYGVVQVGQHAPVVDGCLLHGNTTNLSTSASLAAPPAPTLMGETSPARPPP